MGLDGVGVRVYRLRTKPVPHSYATYSQLASLHRHSTSKYPLYSKTVLNSETVLNRTGAPHGAETATRLGPGVWDAGECRAITIRGRYNRSRLVWMSNLRIPACEKAPTGLRTVSELRTVLEYSGYFYVEWRRRLASCEYLA